MRMAPPYPRVTIRAVDVNLNRWLYKGGHPNLIARSVNRGGAALWATGIGPRRMNTLEVRGRRSGKPVLLPVVVADYHGDRYLVSMLGPRAGWVANVKAAHGKAVLRHGHSERVILEPVPVAKRAAILKRYLELAPAARPHFPLDRKAPLGQFRKIAARYPVFRVRAAR
jgi:deazaflavin-dependent oxidoreductase (nitroreductase family)